MIKGRRKGSWDRLVTIDITEDMIQKANQKATSMGQLRNSILKGEGNDIGFLGEEILRKYLAIESKNSFDYDMVFKDIKIEVKTKRTSVPPEPHYECSVAAYNTKQNCDIYVFARVNYDMTRGWLIGYLKKDDFYKRARKSDAGSTEIENEYLEHATCYKVQAQETNNIKELLT